MKARFVVHRVTDWGLERARRYFLKYLTPDWDEENADDDPVATLLFEVESDQIPAEFEFVHKDIDKHASQVFGEDGIEIDATGEQWPLVLNQGDIVDIEIKKVGHVNWGLPPKEPAA